jgi:hypothetical protein
MARYIDTRMTIDSRRSRARLGWEPRERMSILGRMPFLIDNLRADELEWERRNRAAMKMAMVREHLRIYWLLLRNSEEIESEFFVRIYGPDNRALFPSFQHVEADDHRRAFESLPRQVLAAIRSGDRAILADCCRDLAERRFHEGFGVDEVCEALHLLDRIVREVLRRDEAAQGMQRQLEEQVTAPLRWGCDQARERFEELEERRLRRGERQRLPAE